MKARDRIYQREEVEKKKRQGESYLEEKVTGSRTQNTHKDRVVSTCAFSKPVGVRMCVCAKKKKRRHRSDTQTETKYKEALSFIYLLMYFFVRV